MNRIRMPKRILHGIIGVLVVWVLVGLGVVGAVVSTPIVGEPLGENSAQTIVGDEVVGLRTETSKTYYLGNSTYRLISTGPLHYEDEQGDWQQIDNAIVGGQMLKDAYHLSIIQEDFDEGQVLEWSVEGEYVRFQPMVLGWTNNYDMWDEISMPQAVTGLVVNTPMPLLEEGDGYSQGKVVWDNAYGSGRDFQWTSTPHRLEKLLTLDDAPPAPAQYIIDGGNPVLRLSFIFAPSADLDIYVDGALWNKNTKVTTFNAIEFKKDGETLWVFNPAVYWDATDKTQIGETTLRRVGSDLWIDVLVPYEWLQTASYPVYIDPTLNILISSKDSYMASGLPTLPAGDSLSLACGYDFYAAGIQRPLVEFSISGLPAGATITTATMSLYYYYKDGTPAGNTHYAYRLLRRDWVEAQATWNIYKTGSSWTTAGASSSATDYTTTAGASTTVPGSFGWMNWAITNQVITAYDNSWTVDCRVHSSDEVTAEFTRYHSKEYTDDTSRRPKLVIDYTAVPEAECQAASNIGSTTARLNGIITNDKGNDCEARFRYGEVLQKDDFEWGIDGDPLSDDGGGVDWTTATGGGTSAARIDTGQYHAGTRSGELYQDGTNYVYSSFPQAALTPTQVLEFWIQKDTNSYFLFYHGNNDDYYINVLCGTDEQLGYRYGASDYVWITTLLVDTWYKIAIKDVNWTAGTFDLYLDDDLVAGDAAMRPGVLAANMRFQNSNTGIAGSLWIDDVLVHEEWTVTNWQNSLNTDSTYYEDIASLDPETDYVFQTQPREIVGDVEGLWSPSLYFTTTAAGYSFGVVIG